MPILFRNIILPKPRIQNMPQSACLNGVKVWDHCRYGLLDDVVDVSVSSIALSDALIQRIPVRMTSNTTPSPLVASASSTTSTNAPWLAFDDSLSVTEWLSQYTSSWWLQLDFGKVVDVWGYSLLSVNSTDPSGRFPRNWTFRGSANGSSWTVLDTVTDEPKTYHVISRVLKQKASYRYYQLNITALYGEYYCDLQDFSFYSAPNVVKRGEPRDVIDMLRNKSWFSEGGTPQWIRVDLGRACSTTGYRLACKEPTAHLLPTGWELQGSTNNSTWVTLHTVNDWFPSGTWDHTWAYPRSIAYRYYRVYFTQSRFTARPIYLSKWELYE